jgi:hypothetical protein
MVYAMNTLTKMIISMLLEGSDFLIQHLHKFENHVDEFISRAWRLPRQHVNFLNALIRLKTELLSRGPFIKTTEDDLFLKNQEVRSLIDEGLDLKESMITHVPSLATFFHEETIVGMKTTTCEFEAAKLDERKLEIRSQIQENIIKLLEKKRTNQILKLRMREASRGMSELMDQMEIVEESKEIIQKLWVETICLCFLGSHFDR